MADGERTTRPLLGIQCLRAVAAGMVLWLHLQRVLRNYAATQGRDWAEFTSIPLGAGVDLFFVISGFIIVYSSERLFGRASAGEFLRKRLIRVIPLYWLATALQITFDWIGYLIRHKPVPDAAMIAASLLFIPYDCLGYGSSFPFPILNLGWSLNFEMLFYVLFALCIFQPRRRAVATVSIMLSVMVAAGALIGFRSTVLEFWTHPLVFEFVAGMCIALWLRGGGRLSAGAAAGLLVLGLAWWAVVHDTWFGVSGGPGSYSWPRLIAWGVGAAAIIAGVALGPEAKGRGVATFAVLGNSSYALYLTHAFSLVVVKYVLAAAGPPVWLLWPIGAVAMLFAFAVAYLTHQVIERPLLRLLERITSRRQAGPVSLDA